MPEMGCGLAYTEMVSAKGLHFGGSAQRSAELLAIDPKEVPTAVQLSAATRISFRSRRRPFSVKWATALR
jgi:tRNA-dihydrouridine synthase